MRELYSKNGFKITWLEILFLVILVVVVILSASGKVHSIRTYSGHILDRATNDFHVQQMDVFLNELQSLNDVTIVVVTRDTPGDYTTPTMIEALQNMGFNQANLLADEACHSFIGIWKNGEVIFQQVGNDETLSYATPIASHFVRAVSGTTNETSCGEIWIDDLQYAVQAQGINIVAVYNHEDTLIDSIAYDVNVPEIPIYRFFYMEQAVEQVGNVEE